MPLKTLLYEEYDGELYGNQRYVAFLLEQLANGKRDLDLELVVPTEGPLYEEARPFAHVTALGAGAWRKRSLALLREVRRMKPGVILCMNDRSCLTAALAALLTRTPIVWYLKGRSRWFWSDLCCFMLTRRVLCIAPASQIVRSPWLRKWFHSKLHLFPHVIPLSEFEQLQPPPLSRSGPLRVLVLSWISRPKGIDVMMDAMHELDQGDANITLRIAGAPPDRWKMFAEEMKQKSRKLKRLSVEWLGWTDDVKSLVAEADVVALPSRSEGVPHSLREGMAAARPVVATSVGGVPFIIEDGQTGFLVPSGDAHAFAQRLEFLANSPELARTMGEKARRSVRELNDLDTHLSRLEEHLRETAKNADEQPNSARLPVDRPTEGGKRLGRPLFPRS